MRPFEDLRFARRGETEVLSVRRHRGLAVRLGLGADGREIAGQELFAAHLEELERRFVRLDEAMSVRVDHRDRLGRIVDERAIARLAVAQRMLCRVPLGDVAQADHEYVGAPVLRTADGDLGREQGAVDTRRHDFRRHASPAKRIARIGQFLEPERDRAVDRDARHQQVDAGAEQFRGWIAEGAVCLRIRAIDDAFAVRRDDDVLDVIEDDLQLGSALLRDFDAERARLVRHELHRAHHRSAFVIHRIVVAAQHLEHLERADASPGHPCAQLPQLRLEQRVQSPHGVVFQTNAGCRGNDGAVSRGIRTGIGAFRG
jgi:hypothetical protein